MAAITREDFMVISSVCSRTNLTENAREDY